MEAEEKKQKRRRRKFTDEFKAGAVSLVLDRGKSKRGTLTSDEKEELARLRKENRELRMERALLKKWAAFFAKESV